jgi:DNA replication ATP-dependent helicase Dna2
MNSEIEEIPSRIFYNGSLVPSADVAKRRLNIKPGRVADKDISKIVDPDLPVVFVDVPGEDSGKARTEEAEVACKIVEALLALGVPSHEVGIITPYRAQQALIRSLLSQHHEPSALSVDTVDRFQGGEREVIILSLARSDEVTSFLADRKRLNVSLSRARSKLILLGHGHILGEHPLFMSILSGLERIVIK